ncbi:adenylate/guanylate cyclase [Nitzschia inconspicua]|uniref:Adenylate/guanylate cyclase n=1 Tax=Nitzschia inconspicua TaxID=303405 RepID=A0A9K3PMI3_9STRA|nr:adenylate/guanylate cyclase [Nitzschia inconspicua]
MIERSILCLKVYKYSTMESPMGSLNQTNKVVLAKMDVEDEENVESLSQSSGRGSNSTSDFSRCKSNGDEEALIEIARKEERNVCMIRFITIAAVIISAISVSSLVYFFATGSDTRNFEIEYNLLVQNIHTLVVWEVKYNFALVQQLCGTITSESLMSNQIFPNVTLPDFEITGGFVDGMGGIMMALFAPLIPSSQKEKWEEYSVLHQDWLNRSALLKVESPSHRDQLHGTIQDHEHDRHLEVVSLDPQTIVELEIPDEPTILSEIWKWDADEKVPVESTSAHDYYAPLWQSSPHNADTVNADLFSDPHISELFSSMINSGETVLSPGYEIGNLFDWMFDPNEKSQKVDPHAFIMEKVHVDFGQGQEVAGFVLALTSFRNLFTRLLPEGTEGIYAVVTGTPACERNMTFLLRGNTADFLGYEDLHELSLDHHRRSVPMELYETVPDDLCLHLLNVYPSKAYIDSFNTNKPVVYTSIVVLAFVVTTIFFLVYERLVTKREQTKNAALRVVSSIFPSNVQEKVLRGATDVNTGSTEKENVIASFYPATTVLFADIEGFTAWSSTREPVQVFRLLECVYGAFDGIARRRKIFKVETVGDCYVAVCGMPEPRKDHAVAMVRFARDCLTRMASLSHNLEVSLGPDTADLGFRVGIHSGPVTGGVLRGQNSRFQLFGDTMNVAARMESTGLKNKIQLSTATAKLLLKAGKEHWIEKREGKVDIKGKGKLETFFVRGVKGQEANESKDATVATNLSSSNHSDQPERSVKVLEHTNEAIANKTGRLVDWNTDVLSRRITAILKNEVTLMDPGMVKHVELSPTAIKQLHHFVQIIASMYNDNPFHNFSHASHVTLSIEKMLSTVKKNNEFASGYANNICNDPLAQFAAVLAALIHDCDHYGIGNTTLVEEKNPIAILYEGKSPAENHSLSLGWELLMEPQFSELVKCICGKDRKEVERLKDLLTKAVLATDVFDKELKEERDKEWEKVFGSDNNNDLNDKEAEQLDKVKATIVMEHLIQASDVVHTMQHWHVYIKWNEHLFEEMTIAYHNGHLSKNPAEFWYQGEIGFFNHYIIPLAKKLKECKVFGVICDEFLDYAEANLKEWETKGQQIVDQFSKKYSCNRLGSNE